MSLFTLKIGVSTQHCILYSMTLSDIFLNFYFDFLKKNSQGKTHDMIVQIIALSLLYLGKI